MGQEHIVIAAARYTAAHNKVKDNPQKLLDANGKGAEECKRVGDECAKGMVEFEKAEETLFKVVDAFLATHENPIVAAAIRFRKADAARALLPPSDHSSRSKDWSPEGKVVIEEYFNARQALLDIVQKSQTRRFEKKEE